MFFQKKASNSGKKDLSNFKPGLYLIRTKKQPTAEPYRGVNVSIPLIPHSYILRIPSDLYESVEEFHVDRGLSANITSRNGALTRKVVTIDSAKNYIDRNKVKSVFYIKDQEGAEERLQGEIASEEKRFDYNPLFNNCEEFANYIARGEHIRSESRDLLFVLSAVGLVEFSKFLLREMHKRT